MRLAFPLVVVMTVLSASLGAGCGPSPQRLACLDYCEQHNDGCLAQATSGPAIQGCSQWTHGCIASCPP